MWSRYRKVVFRNTEFLEKYTDVNKDIFYDIFRNF